MYLEMLIMSDTVTQIRFSMRLERYLREYTEKNVRRDRLSKAEWEKVWQLANIAHTHKILTPELVDEVRIALRKLELPYIYHA